MRVMFEQLESREFFSVVQDQAGIVSVYADAVVVGPNEPSQINISHKTLIVGDLNQDGSVNIDDLLILDQDYFHPLPSPDLFTGDLNGDGVVDTKDFSVIYQAFLNPQSQTGIFVVENNSHSFWVNPTQINVVTTGSFDSTITTNVDNINYWVNPSDILNVPTNSNLHIFFNHTPTTLSIPITYPFLC